VVKTFGVTDVLRDALEPLAPKIRAAFVYGSLAKGTETSASDVDLMVVSDTLTYADVFGALEEAAARLARAVNPTVYASKELARRQKAENAFVKRVLAQPKLWLIGGDRDISA
jgi:predicted nucleotidyltransferase